MQTILIISIAITIACLAFYGAGIYAWTVLIATTILASINLIPQKTSPQPSSDTRNLLTPSKIHLAILAFLLLTLIPLPYPTDIITGSQRHQQNREALQIINNAKAVGLTTNTPHTFSSTRNRAGTMRLMLMLCAIFCTFETTRKLSPTNRNILLHILITIGTIIAIAGRLSYTTFPQGNRLWWLFSVPPFHRPPVGSFLNLNHYSGYIALLAVTAAATTITNIRRKNHITAALTALAAITMGLLVILSASRGATMALAAGILAISTATIIKTRGYLRLAAISSIIVAICATSAIALHNPHIRQRLATLRHPLSDYSVQPRICAWSGAFKVWQHYPITGAGANAFRFAYLQQKDKQFRAYRRFAENEPLHILAEGGVVGIALAIMLFIAIALPLIQYRKTSGRQHPASMHLIALAALATALTHSSVDFIMHLPLYTITLAAIIATASPATFAKSDKLAAGITLLITIALIPLCRPISNYDSNGYIVSAKSNQLANLLTWSPTNPQILRRLAAKASATPTQPNYKFAENCLNLATQYDPTNFEIWLALGKLYLKQNKQNAAKDAFRKVKQIRPWAPTPPLTDKK